jgi:hypothetical protein
MGHWLTRLAAKVRRGGQRPPSPPRRASLSVEALEVREMLSASPRPPVAPPRASTPAVSAPKPQPATAQRVRGSEDAAAPDGPGDQGDQGSPSPPSPGGDLGAGIACPPPLSPGAGPRDGVVDNDLNFKRPPSGSASAWGLLDDFCPAPFAGDVCLSAISVAAVIPLHAAGRGEGSPAAAADSPPPLGIGPGTAAEDHAFSGTEAEGGSDPSEDSSPVLAWADDPAHLDRGTEADAPTGVGTKARSSVFDALDDDDGLDAIEEVADMFAELTESDGASESASPDAPGGPATGALSW